MGSKITYEERTGANACEMYYAYDNSGKLFGFYYDGASGDGFYFYKRNLQGDIIGILNSSGTEVTTYLYDAWGKLVRPQVHLQVLSAQTTRSAYRGYYYDTEISLYYLNQRYYNPEWGRFINADDFMGQTGGLLSHNVFAYCGNNPTNFSDPSGRLFDNIISMFRGKSKGSVWGAAVSAVFSVAVVVGVTIASGGLGLIAGAALGVAVGGASSVIEQVVEDVVNDDPIEVDVWKVVRSAAWGGLGGLGGSAMSKGESVAFQCLINYAFIDPLAGSCAIVTEEAIVVLSDNEKNTPPLYDALGLMC